ncbi:MAG TPA: 2Fe-2S iron-sulfur cluster-binding protein, partial [Candidatus Acidoferrum sp.]|nr:2Fe-2S iron-sulfur cluster-binding protein [Candidatus Acidoferrum sp.]
MPREFTVLVNGTPVSVPAGVTIAVAVIISLQPCRTSIAGQPRGPLCGMGICLECRAIVNGIP